jgi:ornithine lipid ester-linked acyl 2-hydroxylase
MAKFYKQSEIFPFLNIDYLPIKAECRKLTDWIDWPEKDLYLPTQDKKYKFSWKVFPFYGFGKRVPENLDKCPKTAEFLKTIPGLRTALFSRLSPKSILKPHYGWSCLANEVLRCHLGLIVPNDGNKCGICVDHDIEIQREGEWIIFDDSKLHSGFNMTGSDRVVLLIDINRPAGIPKGVSTAATTDELDMFLNLFK